MNTFSQCYNRLGSCSLGRVLFRNSITFDLALLLLFKYAKHEAFHYVRALHYIVVSFYNIPTTQKIPYGDVLYVYFLNPKYPLINIVNKAKKDHRECKMHSIDSMCSLRQCITN